MHRGQHTPDFSLFERIPSCRGNSTGTRTDGLCPTPTKRTHHQPEEAHSKPRHNPRHPSRLLHRRVASPPTSTCRMCRWWQTTLKPPIRHAKTPPPSRDPTSSLQNIALSVQEQNTMEPRGDARVFLASLGCWWRYAQIPTPSCERCRNRTPRQQRQRRLLARAGA